MAKKCKNVCNKRAQELYCATHKTFTLEALLVRLRAKVLSYFPSRLHAVTKIFSSLILTITFRVADQDKATQEI